MKIESVFVALSAALAAVAPFVFWGADIRLCVASWLTAAVAAMFAVALWRV